MTYIQAFDKIKEKLDGKAKVSDEYNGFAIQVTLTNKDSHGIFYLKYADGFLDVQPYDYFDNDAAVSLSYQTFLKLVDGRLTLDDAVSKGLIEIYGGHSVVGAICSIVPQDKPQAAKTQSKASASKKTENAAKSTKVTDSTAKKTVKKVETKTAPKAKKATKSTAAGKEKVSEIAKTAAKPKAEKTTLTQSSATVKKATKSESKSKK